MSEGRIARRDPMMTSRFHEPDKRRAPERDESLAEWLNRQLNPERATVEGNAAILARLNRRGHRWVG